MISDFKFIEPKKNGYTVYKKTGCHYCDKVVISLQGVDDVLWVQCDEYLKTKREEFIQFIESKAGKPWRTFPIVFHNGAFVGGSTDLDAYLPWDGMTDLDF
jgi:glutaredoxin